MLLQQANLQYDSTKDYYAVLGVADGADRTRIREAYQEMMLLYHPDKTTRPEDIQRCVELNEAYDVLVKSGCREAYDRRRKRIIKRQIFGSSHDIWVLQECAPHISDHAALLTRRRTTNYPPEMKARRSRSYWIKTGTEMIKWITSTMRVHLQVSVVYYDWPMSFLIWKYLSSHSKLAIGPVDIYQGAESFNAGGTTILRHVRRSLRLSITQKSDDIANGSSVFDISSDKSLKPTAYKLQVGANNAHEDDSKNAGLEVRVDLKRREQGTHPQHRATGSNSKSRTEIRATQLKRGREVKKRLKQAEEREKRLQRRAAIPSKCSPDREVEDSSLGRAKRQQKRSNVLKRKRRGSESSWDGID